MIFQWLGLCQVTFGKDRLSPVLQFTLLKVPSSVFPKWIYCSMQNSLFLENEGKITTSNSQGRCSKFVSYFNTGFSHQSIDGVFNENSPWSENGFVCKERNYKVQSMQAKSRDEENENDIRFAQNHIPTSILRSIVKKYVYFLGHSNVGLEYY